MVHQESGGTETSNIRTSSGMFLTRKQDAVVAEAERKFSLFANIHEGQGEGLQVGAHVPPSPPLPPARSGSRLRSSVTITEAVLECLAEGDVIVFFLHTKPDAPPLARHIYFC